MKVTINRLRVLEISDGAESLKTLTGVKLTYAIVKNLKALKTESETIREAAPKHAGLEKYNAEYTDMLETEAKKDANGNNIPAGGGNIVLENPKSFTAKMDVLKIKYKKELDTAKLDNEEFEKFLKEPFEFEIHQFGEELIPETITLEQMGLMVEMIKGE